MIYIIHKILNPNIHYINYTEILIRKLGLIDEKQYSNNRKIILINDNHTKNKNSQLTCNNKFIDWVFRMGERTKTISLSS